VDQHKAISEDKKWMYDADPFDAKKRLEKQSTAAQSSTKATSSAGKGLGQTFKSDYPEVLMATSLRDLVEDAIKQVCALRPSSTIGTVDSVFELKTGTGIVPGHHRIYTARSCAGWHYSAHSAVITPRFQHKTDRGCFTVSFCGLTVYLYPA
jgi:hypothetical protein